MNCKALWVPPVSVLEKVVRNNPITTSCALACVTGLVLAFSACGPIVVHPAPFEELNENNQPDTDSVSVSAAALDESAAVSQSTEDVTLDVPPAIPPLPLLPRTPYQPDRPYRLASGDEVEIKFFFSPELNERVQIAPDGTISMMFAPHVRAAGLTLDELTEHLKVKLAPHVKQPDMIIIVRNYGSQKVYVAGEVSRPGPVHINGAETVLQVLDEAGWVTPAAGTSNVILVRRDNKTGEKKLYTLDVSKLMTGEDMTQDVLLLAGDVVLVPPSGSVSADRWVDQNIRQILPFSTNVSGAYYLNSPGAAVVP